MKAEFSPEIIEKAKEARSAAALITLAKENGTEITPEEAANYFAKLNPPSGTIADEELANVAGGGCSNADGRMIVTAFYKCEHWSCLRCGMSWGAHIVEPNPLRYCSDGTRLFQKKNCSFCGYCSACGPNIVCNHPANHT